MPEDVAVAEPVITPEVDVAPIETEGAPVEPVEQVEAPVETKPEEAQGDGRFLSPELRKLFGELKTTNPKLEKHLRGLFFADKALKEKFPNGIEEVSKIQQRFTDLGGEEGIAELAGAKQELDSIDVAASKGDPAFIEKVIEQFPQAFPKLVEHAATRWADAHPESYQRYMSRVFMATLNNGGVSNNLYRMGLALQMGNADEAKKILGEIDQWTKGIDQVAKSQPKVEAKQSPDLDKREQTLAQREANLFHQDVGRDVDTFVKDTLYKEIEKYTKGKLTDDQKDAAWELAQGRLATALKADQKYLTNSSRFAQARDKDGLVKLQKAEIPKVIEGDGGVAHKVYRLLFSQGMAKPTPKPTPTNGAPPKPVQQGWTVINVRPQPHEVDRRLTTDEMIFEHRYILKSGKRVMLSA